MLSETCSSSSSKLGRQPCTAPEKDGLRPLRSGHPLLATAAARLANPGGSLAPAPLPPPPLLVGASGKFMKSKSRRLPGLVRADRSASNASTCSYSSGRCLDGGRARVGSQAWTGGSGTCIVFSGPQGP